jgi:hypothetical protein
MMVHRISTAAQCRHTMSSSPFSSAVTALMPSPAGTDDAPAVRLLADTLGQASELDASDIHVEPGEHGFRIRLRIDGVLHETARPPAHLRDAFITRVKVLARLDIAERRVPQDGRLRLALAPGKVEDYRVSSLPTLFGEKLVLRRLDTLPSDRSRWPPARRSPMRSARSRARRTTPYSIVQASISRPASLTASGSRPRCAPPAAFLRRSCSRSLLPRSPAHSMQCSST